MTLALDTAQSNISQDRPGYNDVYIMKLSLVVNNLLVQKIWYNESYFDYTSLIVTLTMKIAMQIFIWHSGSWWCTIYKKKKKK